MSGPLRRPCTGTHPWTGGRATTVVFAVVSQHEREGQFDAGNQLGCNEHFATNTRGLNQRESLNLDGIVFRAGFDAQGAHDSVGR